MQIDRSDSFESWTTALNGVPYRYRVIAVYAEGQSAPAGPVVGFPYTPRLAVTGDTYIATLPRVATLDTLLGVAKDWNHDTLSRMPGFRDRIGLIRLTSEEGGLNLSMPKERIEEVVPHIIKNATATPRFVAPGVGVGRVGRQHDGAHP